MSTTRLQLVAGTPEAETLAHRVRSLQAQIRALGQEQVAAMRASVADGIDAACEVAANPAQPDGIRQLAAKIVRDGESLLLTLDAISARAS